MYKERVCKCVCVLLGARWFVRWPVLYVIHTICYIHIHVVGLDTKPNADIRSSIYMRYMVGDGAFECMNWNMCLLWVYFFNSISVVFCMRKGGDVTAVFTITLTPCAICLHTLYIYIYMLENKRTKPESAFCRWRHTSLISVAARVGLIIDHNSHNTFTIIGYKLKAFFLLLILFRDSLHKSRTNRTWICSANQEGHRRPRRRALVRGAVALCPVSAICSRFQVLALKSCSTGSRETRTTSGHRRPSRFSWNASRSAREKRWAEAKWSIWKWHSRIPNSHRGVLPFRGRWTAEFRYE